MPNWIEQVNWKEIITKAGNSSGVEIGFTQPITIEEIKDLEEKLSVEFPPELLSFYKHTNGIKEKSDDQIVGDLVWSSSHLIERNLEMRNYADFADLYMPFDCLLFFAHAGNGNLFGIPVLNNKCPRLDIFVWNHEDDSRTWVSGYLHKFLENLFESYVEI